MQSILESLISWDKELFLALNANHSPWLDRFMWMLSETWSWLPVGIVLLVVLFRNDPKKGLILLFTLGLLITFTDQIASGVVKPLVERFRPTHEPSLEGMVQTVNHYVGGKYGFLSSHAANVFAFAGLSLLLFRNGWYSAVILIWATAVSYSRIYLGVHYPLDVLAGGLFGFLSSLAFYALFRAFTERRGHGSRRGGNDRKRKSISHAARQYSAKEIRIVLLVLGVVLTTLLIASVFLAW